MDITNEIIIKKLTERFGSEVYNVEEPFGLLSFEVPKELNIAVLDFLYNDSELRFQFLTDICTVHYPDYKGRELAVVYHLHNLFDNIRLRFKVFTSIDSPDIQTATVLYECANWMERESYDFFGINFVGHPNLKRIMNVDEMDYFPLRKEYPLEDMTRRDKDDEMFGRDSFYYEDASNNL